MGDKDRTLFVCGDDEEDDWEDCARGVADAAALPDAPLLLYRAYVTVEYDFTVMARSEAEAKEQALRSWPHALSTYTVTETEVDVYEG